MYLDNELMDIDHLCCLAHAKGKVQVCLRLKEARRQEESSLSRYSKSYTAWKILIARKNFTRHEITEENSNETTGNHR